MSNLSFTAVIRFSRSHAERPNVAGDVSRIFKMKLIDVGLYNQVFNKRDL